MAPTLSLKRCRFYLLELTGRSRRRQQRLGRVNDDMNDGTQRSEHQRTTLSRPGFVA